MKTKPNVPQNAFLVGEDEVHKQNKNEINSDGAIYVRIKYQNMQLPNRNELNNKDQSLSLQNFLSKTKQLKNYAHIDNKKNNQMDFDTFKSIIGELYKRESRPNLNFALLKETFDIIDQRKDGYIDMNEWTNSFGKNKGKLDLILNKRQINALRKWETSDNVIGIYTAIAHNKKVIWDKAKKYCFGKGNGAVIQEDNLIRVLKDVFPTLTLTLTQWKMIVEIADKDPADLIQLEQFITIVEHCAKKAKSQPRF